LIMPPFFRIKYYAATAHYALLRITHCFPRLTFYVSRLTYGNPPNNVVAAALSNSRIGAG